MSTVTNQQKEVPGGLDNGLPAPLTIARVTAGKRGGISPAPTTRRLSEAPAGRARSHEQAEHASPERDAGGGEGGRVWAPSLPPPPAAGPRTGGRLPPAPPNRGPPTFPEVPRREGEGRTLHPIRSTAHPHLTLASASSASPCWLHPPPPAGSDRASAAAGAKGTSGQPAPPSYPGRAAHIRAPRDPDSLASGRPVSSVGAIFDAGKKSPFPRPDGVGHLS